MDNSVSHSCVQDKTVPNISYTIIIKGPVKKLSFKAPSLKVFKETKGFFLEGKSEGNEERSKCKKKRNLIRSFLNAIRKKAKKTENYSTEESKEANNNKLDDQINHTVFVTAENDLEFGETGKKFYHSNESDFPVPNSFSGGNNLETSFEELPPYSASANSTCDNISSQDTLELKLAISDSDDDVSKAEAHNYLQEKKHFQRDGESSISLSSCSISSISSDISDKKNTSYSMDSKTERKTMLKESQKSISFRSCPVIEIQDSTSESNDEKSAPVAEDDRKDVPCFWSSKLGENTVSKIQESPALCYSPVVQMAKMEHFNFIRYSEMNDGALENEEDVIKVLESKSPTESQDLLSSNNCLIGKMKDICSGSMTYHRFSLDSNRDDVPNVLDSKMRGESLKENHEYTCSFVQTKESLFGNSDGKNILFAEAVEGQGITVQQLNTTTCTVTDEVNPKSDCLYGTQADTSGKYENRRNYPAVDQSELESLVTSCQEDDIQSQYGTDNCIASKESAMCSSLSVDSSKNKTRNVNTVLSVPCICVKNSLAIPGGHNEKYLNIHVVENIVLTIDIQKRYKLRLLDVYNWFTYSPITLYIRGLHLPGTVETVSKLFLETVFNYSSSLQSTLTQKSDFSSSFHCSVTKTSGFLLKTQNWKSTLNSGQIKGLSHIASKKKQTRRHTAPRQQVQIPYTENQQNSESRFLKKGHTKPLKDDQVFSSTVHRSPFHTKIMDKQELAKGKMKNKTSASKHRKRLKPQKGKKLLREEAENSYDSGLGMPFDNNASIVLKELKATLKELKILPKRTAKTLSLTILQRECDSVFRRKIKKTPSNMNHVSFIKEITRELHMRYFEVFAYGLKEYFNKIESGDDMSRDEKLHFEWLRFISFATYQGEGSAITLARNGFYHDQSAGNTATKCVFCKAFYDSWCLHDDVERWHQSVSPNCPIYDDLSGKGKGRNVKIAVDERTKSKRPGRLQKDTSNAERDNVDELGPRAMIRRSDCCEEREQVSCLLLAYIFIIHKNCDSLKALYYTNIYFTIMY